ncbi:MAG TPA: hypothetical protein DD827_04470 [Gammaproteobacteria bacterium]|nr:hypothetical protein [Gammaproteobacteria bacterium]
MTLSTKEQIKHACNDFEIKIKSIVENVFSIQIPNDDIWICRETLAEVMLSVRAAIQDKRNQYPHNLSAIKYISIVTSWLIKLKPINNVLLIDSDTNKPINFHHINEAVAIYWAISEIRVAIESGDLVELISSSPENLQNLDEVRKFYYSSGFYRSATPPHTEKTNSRKINETINNLRFKRTSSIFIYEMLSHLILPFKLKEAARKDA